HYFLYKSHRLFSSYHGCPACAVHPGLSVAAFDMGQSTRCVAIPNKMRVCKDVGYSEMRLPNFLGHSNLESEVVPRSEDWRPLLQTGCHPQAQAFLCSLIAPDCLDTFIQPCRSLCVAVRDSCAPVLNCDRFPDEDDKCLSLSAETFLPNCPSVEHAPALKTVLDSFCQDDFAVTAKIHRRRVPTGDPEFEIEGRVEFIHQGPLLPYDTRHLLQQWLLINLRSVRPHRGGPVRRHSGLKHVFPWHKKDVNVAVATRKWKHHSVDGQIEGDDA
uniref:Sizzled n=1 Tax=Neogobius melanostomus TaxID=47308 RepID=A0A8C6TYP1_9GOBI